MPNLFGTPFRTNAAGVIPRPNETAAAITATAGAKTGTVSGRVTDDSGNPVSSADIVITPVEHAPGSAKQRPTMMASFQSPISVTDLEQWDSPTGFTARGGARRDPEAWRRYCFARQTTDRTPSGPGLWNLRRAWSGYSPGWNTSRRDQSVCDSSNDHQRPDRTRRLWHDGRPGAVRDQRLELRSIPD